MQLKLCWIFFYLSLKYSMSVHTWNQSEEQNEEIKETGHLIIL